MGLTLTANEPDDVSLVVSEHCSDAENSSCSAWHRPCREQPSTSDDLSRPAAFASAEAKSSVVITLQLTTTAAWERYLTGVTAVFGALVGDVASWPTPLPWL